ncbi:GNAT family N-acetyltransferase [Frigidibacter oleivorans]|uniref:GNAT family N-acetyltransferase n=1 Tax=Frigidibacter oleivorans TaxID=2487129 RepID=UPI000F8D65F2|nr:GNAT family protein [Frigidibacter oleivorans]
MPLDLIMGADLVAPLRAWAEERLGLAPGRLPPDAVPMGVVDDDGQIVAVITASCFMNGACTLDTASNGSRRWADRGILKLVGAYVFLHRGCRRMTTLTAVSNHPAQIAALRAGFQFEARLRGGYFTGEDAILFGMRREECTWLEGGH